MFLKNYLLPLLIRVSKDWCQSRISSSVGLEKRRRKDEEEEQEQEEWEEKEEEEEEEVVVIK